MVTERNKQAATPPRPVLCDMDLQVQVTRNHRSPTSPSFVLGEHKARAAIGSPPTVGKLSAGAKLPPLSLEAASDSHPSSVVLKQAKDEVQAVMKHLLVEVRVRQ